MILRLVFSFFLFSLVTGNQRLEDTKEAARSDPCENKHCACQDQQESQSDHIPSPSVQIHQESPSLRQPYKAEESHYGYPQKTHTVLSSGPTYISKPTQTKTYEFVSDNQRPLQYIQEDQIRYPKKTICVTPSMVNRMVRAALEYVSQMPSDINLVIDKIDEDLYRMSNQESIEEYNMQKFHALDSKSIFKMLKKPSRSEVRTNLILKYDRPSVQESQCKEALEKLIEIAYNAYLELEQHPQCRDYLYNFASHQPEDRPKGKLDYGPDVQSLIATILDQIDKYRPKSPDYNHPSYYPGPEIDNIPEIPIPQVHEIREMTVPQVNVPQMPQLHQHPQIPIPQVNGHQPKGPQNNEYNIPLVKEYNVPQVQEYNTPQVQEYNIPQVTEYKVPQGQEYNIPHVQGYNTPQLKEYNVPQVQEYNMPQVQEYNIPQVQGYNIPQVQEYNIPHIQEYNTPQLKEYNVPQVQEYKIPHVQEYNTPQVKEYNIPYLKEYNTPQAKEYRIPQVQEYSTPQVKDYSIPQVQEYTTPQVKDYSIPQVQEYTTPQVKDYSIPQVQEYSTPQVKDYSIPQVQEYNIPQVQEYNMPQVQEYNTPQVKEYNIPHVQGYNTPQVKEYNMPYLKEYNTPQVKEYNIPQVQEYSTPQVKDYSIPQGQEFNIPQVQEYNIPQVQEYNIPQVQEYNIPQVQEYNIPQVQEYNTPLLKEYNTPQVKEYRIPQINEFNTPQLKEYNTPQVNEYRIPQMNEYNTPQLKEYNSPQVNEYDTPHIKEYNTPQVKEYNKPKVKEYNKPKVKDYNKVPVHGYNIPQVHDYRFPQSKDYSKPQAQGYSIPQIQGINIPQIHGMQYPQIHDPIPMQLDEIINLLINILNNNDPNDGNDVFDRLMNIILENQHNFSPQTFNTLLALLNVRKQKNIPRFNEIFLLLLESEKNKPWNDITREYVTDHLVPDQTGYLDSRIVDIIIKLYKKPRSQKHVEYILSLLKPIKEGRLDPRTVDVIFKLINSNLNHLLHPDSIDILLNLLKQSSTNEVVEDEKLGIIDNLSRWNEIELKSSQLKLILSILKPDKLTGNTDKKILDIIYFLLTQNQYLTNTHRDFILSFLYPENGILDRRRIDIIHFIINYALTHPRLINILISLLRNQTSVVMNSRFLDILLFLHSNRLLTPELLDAGINLLTYEVTGQLNDNHIKSFFLKLAPFKQTHPKVVVDVLTLLNQGGLYGNIAEWLDPASSTLGLSNPDMFPLSTSPPNMNLVLEKVEPDKKYKSLKYRIPDGGYPFTKHVNPANPQPDDEFLNVFKWLEGQPNNEGSGNVMTEKLLKILELGERELGVVELTYMLKHEKPLIYQPVYYVKYRLPILSFVSNMKNLLMENPQLTTDPQKLLQEMIVISNVTEVSPNLQGYPKEEILKLTVNDGDLVQAKILDEQNLNLNEQITYVHGLNSDISPEEILQLNMMNEAKYFPTIEKFHTSYPKKVMVHEVNKIVQMPSVHYHSSRWQESGPVETHTIRHTYSKPHVIHSSHFRKNAQTENTSD